LCVIICCESKFPSKSILEDAEHHNDHGGGVAWLTRSRKVRYIKGITGEQILKMIDKKKLKLPCIIHFRLTSCGSTCDQLTHPFPITENAETDLKGTVDQVLFHNGTWSSYDNRMLDAVFKQGLKIPSGKWSDSRAMAWLAFHYGSGYLNFITGSRMAILNKNGIEYYGSNWDYDTIDGEEQKDIVYSNLFWKKYVNTNDNDEGYGYLQRVWRPKYEKMMSPREFEREEAKDKNKGEIKTTVKQLADNDKSATELLKKNSDSNSHSTHYDKKQAEVNEFIKEAIKEGKKLSQRNYGNLDGVDIEYIPVEDLTLKQVMELEDRYIKRMAKYEMSVECLEFNKQESMDVKFVRKCEKKINKRRKQMKELDDMLFDLYENTKLNPTVIDIDKDVEGNKITSEDYENLYDETQKNYDGYSTHNMYGMY